MKKLFIAFSIIALVVILIGADIRRDQSSNLNSAVVAKKKCVGYTIIEFGKGIDCNGDTVKLIKVDGGQALEKVMDEIEEMPVASLK
jgi:preprotein translocase subunit SecD